MALKDLFIKSDEQQNTNVTTALVQKTETSAPTNVVTPSSSVVSQSNISSNDEIVAKIWQTVVDKNLPGPDYLELKNNVNALNGMPLTDEQKLVSSFNILQANYPKFSKDVILRSIDTYVSIVNDEKSAGLAEVQKMRAEKIEGKEKLIEKLKEEAASLKEKYDSVLKQIDEYTTSVATERLSIDNQERVFTASVETVLNTLESDKTKISTINI